MLYKANVQYKSLVKEDKSAEQVDTQENGISPPQFISRYKPSAVSRNTAAHHHVEAIVVSMGQLKKSVVNTMEEM